MSTAKQGLLVIGAGPGGYPAAFLAADKGLKTTLIDPEPNPGGVCLYRGCIPTKTLLHASKVIREARELSQWGVEFPAPVIKPEMIKKKKDRVVSQITSGVGRLCKQRDIEYIQGRARFINDMTVLVEMNDGTKEEMTFDNAIIATGSSPSWIPGLTKDSPKIVSSAQALDIEDIPGTMLVIGGGVIGLEFGMFYSQLGTEVSVIELMDSILPLSDPDLVRVFKHSTRKIYKEIMTSTKVVSVNETAHGVEVTFEKDGKQYKNEYSKVLVTTGRKPNSADLGLENAGICVDEKGFIKTDKYLKTAASSIFAIGDVIGGAMLAHKATYEGKLAVKNILGENKECTPSSIPSVLYTDPEIASVGLTETAAREKGIDASVTRFQWGASGRAVTIGRTDGITKLIIDNKTGKVLGMGIVGPGAGELIAEGALALEMGATAHDIAKTIHPHPTMSETIMEAAEMHSGLCTHMYMHKR